MENSPYQKLANRLDTLPNGYPAAADGSELRILEYLFSAEEAALAANLRANLEQPNQIADRLNMDPAAVRTTLKDMARKGLIQMGKLEGRLGFGLLPFVVGIYEYQLGNMNTEFAHLIENYFQQTFQQTLTVTPQFHRVIPVNETVKNDMAVYPYESAAGIVEEAKAWGVQDCICRVQKNLIGDGCDHPVDVCMVFAQRPDVFNGHAVIRPLTMSEAMDTLKRAADAGLVHSVSNSKSGTTYICNCCTCSCGILRGMAEVGIANVVARSAFVNTVDADVCQGCETCIEYCQFDALALAQDDFIIEVNAVRCVGCGVCVPVCPDQALLLVRRPEDQIKSIPETHDDWFMERAEARGIDLKCIL